MSNSLSDMQIHTIFKYHRDGRVQMFEVGSEPGEPEGWFNSPGEAKDANVTFEPVHKVEEVEKKAKRK